MFPPGYGGYGGIGNELPDAPELCVLIENAILLGLGFALEFDEAWSIIIAPLPKPMKDSWCVLSVAEAE